VREPPAPRYGHQSIVTHLGALLDAHVRAEALGVVAVSPIDVVLDAARHLVVQPDILFVSADRRRIIRDQLWGPPDLVVEVLSRGSARHDTGLKLRWYRRYGVRECWLADPATRAVVVVPLGQPPQPGGRVPRRRRVTRGSRIRSWVLPGFDRTADEVFA
jgi:Uma2 family endonuclease